MIGVGRWIPEQQVAVGEGRAMILAFESGSAILSVSVAQVASARTRLTPEDLRHLAGQALAAALDIEAARAEG